MPLLLALHEGERIVRDRHAARDRRSTRAAIPPEWMRRLPLRRT
jgi:hypothetical protein